MKPAFGLHLLVLLALFCAIAGAEPTAKVTTDFRVDLAVGAWIDLVVEIDPQDDPIAAEDLSVVPAPSEAIEFGAPILPPAGEDGRYGQPFEVRVPARFSKKATAEIAIKAGSFATSVALKPGFVLDRAKGHVTGTAALQKPAVAGEANAIVLTLNVGAFPPEDDPMGLPEQYHVYGAAGKDDGLPFVAAMLPAGPERLWIGGGPVTPPDKKYKGDFKVEIPFTPVEAGRVETRVVLFWQACTATICDPNEVSYLPVAFDVAEGDGPVVVPDEAGSGTSGVSAAGSSAGSPGADYGAAGLLELILLAIGAGLFALAMPCTYPLIPITISFFTKQAEKRKEGVLPLALTYGAGIVAIFAGIGLAVGLGVSAGEDVLAFAVNPWVNGLFALLFLVFGLSLIGLFEIRLPGFVNDLAAKASGGGGYLSVFAMGTTLVITSFTCTAPFVGSLLVYASRSGDWKVVTGSMAVFGLTMAIPFVFLSLSPTAIQKMPRSGVWMKHLKVTLGIVELGLVLKFVSNIDLAIGTFLIGRELFLALWGASFLAAGLYLLGAFNIFRRGADWSLTGGRAVAAGVLLLITGYLYGGLGGEPRNFARLEAFLPVIDARYDRSFVAVVKEDLEEGIRIARKEGVPIFLHFTGYT